MCGRLALTAPKQVALRFDLDPATMRTVEAHSNIAPGQDVPVIVADPDGQLALEWPRWGFQPAWATDSRRPAPINARAETLVERPFFRPAVRQGRWLDPDITVPEAVLDCLRPYPAEAMATYPVSPRVNTPQHEGPALIAALVGAS